ncbi:glycosyl transferase [Citreicella sp. C3M06]|uniref:glycosyl transferase n=1 Tax=Citreicella sp. C3M06 TaxID=2841564 RepID=UPI001C09D7C3|nr:glycosyl transferase [Citreicella sp. C3M06]MBU2960331.1 glycosyl transferase [Citreicella sp. C3M06]
MSKARPRLIVFGFDAAEAAQIRRMRSYLDCGFDVMGFMMRRANMNLDFKPFWDNVHLFQTINGGLPWRVAAVAGSVLKVLLHRRSLVGADVIVARNLDLLAVAVAARAMVRPKPRVIYECLDIHGLMTDPGLKGRVTRALERALLARTDALIISSPAFLREYFAPVQKWDGPVALVENKLWIEDGGPGRPAPPSAATPDEWTEETPIRLAWVGTLRCARSLDILAQAAERMGPRLQIALHGAVHHHAVPDFDAILARHPNMTWHGAYDYPDDLAPIYAQNDLVWSQDLWQWGTNSTWLLPNRIYEASYFGCPSIAVAGTETGHRVENGLGWTVPEPSADALCALLNRLTPAEVAARRQALLSRPESEFRQSAAEISNALRAGMPTAA